MKDYKPFILAFAIIILIWIANLFCLPYLLPDYDTMGRFGDSFGAVNALFSGMAFSAIVGTILIHRKSLQLQREELELTRKELKKSTEAQADSHKALAIQIKLMTKQALLSAYQVSYSTQLELLNSDAATANEKSISKETMATLKNKIEAIIVEIEKEQNLL